MPMSAQWTARGVREAASRQLTLCADQAAPGLHNKRQGYHYAEADEERVAAKRMR
jgi:hypothetical protein